MNCDRFELWLDEGGPGREAAEARRHARECARCAAAFDAALELEAAMSASPAAPRGFTDRVMARVAETPQVASRAASATLPAMIPTLTPAMAWWVRAAMEPPVLLAATLAAILVGWGDALVRGANATGAIFMRTMTDGASQVAGVARVEDPRVVFAVAIALAPSLIWASRRLYRLGSKLAG